MRRCACWSGARGPAASLAGRVQAARVVGKPGSTTHTSDVGAIKPPKPTVLVTRFFIPNLITQGGDNSHRHSQA
jgi:hypothetical protein